jgi:DNA-binding response OmpR family regulator
MPCAPLSGRTPVRPPARETKDRKATDTQSLTQIATWFRIRPAFSESRIMSKNEDTLVLVADDEPSMLALLSAYIRSKGYRVLEASDGDMAWQLAREHLPHAVVLDVMMPGMSGWEVCKKIRESVSLAHTGVVMLTGIGESLNELTSPLYGADAYIDKPFEFAELEARIKETLERRRDGALGRPDGGSNDEDEPDDDEDEDEDEDETSGDEDEDEESGADDDEEPGDEDEESDEDEDEDEDEKPAPRAKKSSFEEDEPVTQRFAKASAQKKAKKASSRATDEDEMEVDELIEEAQAEVQAKKKAGKKKASKKAGKKAAGKKKASKKAGKKAAGKKKASKKAGKKAAGKKKASKKAGKKAAGKKKASKKAGKKAAGKKAKNKGRR